jgi:hypothetical protein
VPEFSGIVMREIKTFRLQSTSIMGRPGRTAAPLTCPGGSVYYYPLPGLTIRTSVNHSARRFRVAFAVSNRGPGHGAAVAALLGASSLADDVAFAATAATTNQKESIGRGLADAVGFFAKSGCPCQDSERPVRSAISFADSSRDSAL